MREAALPLLRPRRMPPGVVAAFTTRAGGVSPAPYDTLNLGLSTADDPAHVHENRRRLAGACGMEGLALAGQVHGAVVRVVEAPGLYPGCDALVTTTPGLLLGLTAADCASVLLADTARPVVGACHAGWRGAVAGIVGRTVAAMTALGARPETLVAYVSPCISVRHFEVGPEVAAQFAARYVHRPPGAPRPFVDLKAALAGALAAAGVPEVEVSPRCTVAEADVFFSHRASGGTTGRMMGVIGLSPVPNP